MKIRKYYLTRSQNTRIGERIQKIDSIVITECKKRGVDALSARNIVERGKYNEDEYFSCHYIVGKEILNIVPDTEASTCTRGSIDMHSISIMLCPNNDGNINISDVNLLKELIATIKEKYDIKNDNIFTEYDINGSRRPKEFVDEPILLEDIIQRKITRVVL